MCHRFDDAECHVVLVNHLRVGPRGHKDLSPVHNLKRVGDADAHPAVGATVVDEIVQQHTADAHTHTHTHTDAHTHTHSLSVSTAAGVRTHLLPEPRKPVMSLNGGSWVLGMVRYSATGATIRTHAHRHTLCGWRGAYFRGAPPTPARGRESALLCRLTWQRTPPSPRRVCVDTGVNRGPHGGGEGTLTTQGTPH